MKQFSQKEKEDICQNYLINYNIQNIAREYGVSPARIKTVLKSNNIKIISDRKELWKMRYPRKSDIFEKIDTKEKAYWLGFIFADGGIEESSNTLRINLSSKDEEHLYKFKNFIQAFNTEIKRNDKIENDKIYKISYFGISDKKLIKDLKKYGCVSNKTYKLDFPSSNLVPKNLIYHFVRGFFDGDGSIYTDDKRNRLCLNFTGTELMLNGIKKVLKKDNLKLENKGKYSVLHIDGNKQVVDILNKIYKDSNSEIELTRKKQKFHDFLLRQ